MVVMVNNNISSIATLMIRNLRLLRFTTDACPNINFGENMFNRPNELGLYHILYFLFRKLALKNADVSIYRIGIILRPFKQNNSASHYVGQ